VVVDRDRHIRATNDAFRRALGMSNGDWSGACQGAMFGCVNATGNHVHNDELSPECQTCDLRRLAFSALDDNRRVHGATTLDVVIEGSITQLRLEMTALPLNLAGEDFAVLIVENMTELEVLKPTAPIGTELGIVGQAPAIRELMELVRQVAPMDVPVLIQGESGTGKELVAHALHRLSARSHELMVPVNCGALPDGLLESELFGHVRGAFTGAVRDKKGRFELADRGTIFLDEIGELGPGMQVKFLRVLQNGTFERVGGERTVKVDARLVCATNRDLAAEVASGRFRSDLYFRLCVVPITVPPLRERASDIPALAEHFLKRADLTVSERDAESMLAPETLDVLCRHPWPGNVRELENAIRFAAIRARGGVIQPDHLPATVVGTGRHRIPAPTTRNRTGLTTDAVHQALVTTDGNRSRAAKVLGVSRATLYRFLSDHPDEW
jgi:transcriptional regulator with GAF, ATPase, and Fis domain